MKLEQITRNSSRVPSEKIYSIVDLKCMSSSVFYSGEANNGCGLTIRPLGPNTQLHIHEGPGGRGHIKTRDGSYQSLNAYDSAMADYLLNKAGVPKIKKENGHRI